MNHALIEPATLTAQAPRRGFWSRLGEAIEDASLSHAERLERRIGLLEQQVLALQEQARLPIRESRS